MIGASGHVIVHGYGPVGVIVYVPDADHVKTALHLAALLYATREVEESGRRRAA